VLLPLVPLCVVVFGFTIINLIRGQSFTEVMIRLGELWQISKPYLQGLNVIIGVLIALTILWKNKGKIINYFRKQGKS